MAKLVRGFRDIFEPQSKNFTELENCARGVFSLYGFGELRLPTVELRELFIKSTGETTDIVQKEMYAFEDAGRRQLAIRPEGTPGVVRAFSAASLYKPSAEMSAARWLRSKRVWSSGVWRKDGCP